MCHVQLVIQHNEPQQDRNDHTTMTAPLPVCSAKLSMFGLGQYYGGGPRWNPECCTQLSLLPFFWLLLLPFALCPTRIEQNTDAIEQNTNRIEQNFLAYYWEKLLDEFGLGEIKVKAGFFSSRPFHFAYYWRVYQGIWLGEKSCIQDRIDAYKIEQKFWSTAKKVKVGLI